jgi:ABC-type lipoprotein export system ATPase subunit
MPSQLSGGEQQRVAIAGAGEPPPIILADEPTAPLDSERAMAVIRILNAMAREYEICHYRRDDEKNHSNLQANSIYPRWRHA